MRLAWLVPFSLTTSLALLGCGDDSNQDTTNDDDVGESGSGDSSSTASESGTSTSDTGSTDATATDTGSTDATSTDTGSTDATSTDTGSTDATDSTDSDSTDATDSTDSTTTDTTDTGMPICECAPNTDLIYVLSDDGELWSYDPVNNAFDQITANLGCPQNAAFSMSVDRNGVAHVMFQNDDIYTVDVNNPNQCLDPMYQPGQLGFNKFGMGFVSNDQFDPCDKLYAHSWNGQGGFSEGPNTGRLGRMEPDTLVMEEIGSINYNGGELTGTGDGRLFAFAGAPAKLVEYDKDTAQVIATEQLGLSLTNAFAFGFYGGDFYLFTEANNNPNVSKVTHYDYDDTKMLSTVVMAAPIRIVGAGVSTCVPLAM